MTPWPSPSLRHVARLTDAVGIVEHARGATPQPAVGYCTDDAGRALAVAARLAGEPRARRVATVALGFLGRAQLGDGRFRLRFRPRVGWGDERSDDADGRALLGLGTALGRAPWPEVRAGAAELFDAAARGFRSSHPRALAYAALGAVEVLAADPRHAAARHLVADAAERLPERAADRAWPWPAPRLTYANALLPEALLAVATATGRVGVDRGLDLLGWLVREETLRGRFSFTPVGGRGPLDPKPAFDQQPIEAWAMADACARAHAVTRDGRWLDALDRAGAWFLGDNDVGVAVFDPATGGGYDGLERDGVNRNQGAESTLAFVATMARVRAARRGPQAARSSAASASRSSR
jgi:hypothetical protein